MNNQTELADKKELKKTYAQLNYTGGKSKWQKLSKK